MDTASAHNVAWQQAMSWLINVAFCQEMATMWYWYCVRYSHFSLSSIRQLMTPNICIILTMGVWLTKIGSDLVQKNPNHPNIWHAFRWFSKRNCTQSTIQIQSKETNFTCIQCAHKERLKTWPKHKNKVWHFNFIMPLHHLLVVVVASDVSVIFAVN